MANPFVPPPKADLDQHVEAVIGVCLGMAGDFDKDFLDGTAAILTAQFPDIPRPVLGRIAVSVAMAGGSYVGGLAELGQKVPGAMVTDMLATAGALMTQESANDSRTEAGTEPTDG